jgi:hypothetical protein
MRKSVKAATPINPQDPVMGGHTAVLTPCPVALVSGWVWVEWADPVLTCSSSGTTGHRFGWRSKGREGIFVSPEYGPEEATAKKVSRGSSENGESKPRSSKRKFS